MPDNESNIDPCSQEQFKKCAAGLGMPLRGRPWTSEELANFLQCAPQSLAAMRCRGTGPQFIKVNRMVRYLEIDILVWLAVGDDVTVFQFEKRVRK